MKLGGLLILSFLGAPLFVSSAEETQTQQVSSAESKKLATQWEFAEGLFGRGFYEDAALEYRSIYTGGRTRIQLDALLRIIECTEMLKRPMASLLDEYIEREQDPDKRAVILLKKATVLQGEKKFDEALALYTNLAKEKGLYQEYALYDQGRLCLELKREGEAIKSFSSLVDLGDLETNEVRLYGAFALGTLYLDKNELAQSKKYFAMVAGIKVESNLRESALVYLLRIENRLEDDSALLNSFKSLKALYPKSSFYNEAALQAAMALIRRKEYEQARAELVLLKDLSPEQTSLKEYAEALCFYHLNLFEEARVLFEKVAFGETQFSESASAGAYAVFSLSHLENLEQCKELVAKFIKRFPNSALRADVHYCLGLLAVTLKNDALAESHLSQSLKTYLPNWNKANEVYRVFAEFYEAKKNHGKAATLWESLIERVSGDLQDEIRFRAIENRVLNEDFILAMKHVDVLRKAKRHSQRVNILTCEIALQSKKYKEVLTSAQSILSELGYSKYQIGAVRVLKARAHYFLQEGEAAKDELEQALDVLSVDTDKSAEARLMLGVVLEGDGKKSDAAAVYADYFKLKQFKLLPVGSERLYEMSRLLELEGYFKAALISCDELETAGKANLAQLERMRIYMRSQEFKKAELLAVDLVGNDSLKPEFRCLVLAITANCALIDKKYDKASRFFELALNLNSWEEGDYPMALYGKALLSLEQSDYVQAWKQAGRVYILHKDKDYTPASLFLAMRAAVKLERLNDAKKVWQELKIRYAAYSNGNEVSTFAVKHALD